MARKSPVYYIPPSNISITPNANGLQNDLAVYVTPGTKIKVLCPRAGIGMDDTSFREWTISARNRRLNDDDGVREYTIYVRLPKNDNKGGYIVFAPKTASVDKYKYLTLDTVSGLSDSGSNTSADYWYIRLGDVSLPSGGKRTLTCDTGILGTEQWNNEWSMNPDNLPLHIELGCTVDNEDVGLNPYVYWGQQVVLTANLVEGWSGVDVQRFDHWEILRNSGNEEADRNWLDPTREAAFSSSGEITLSHSRTDDDFDGAVAVTFTVMAMEVNEDYIEGSGDVPFLPIKTATITILAETVEGYEIAVSENIVSYNPRTNEYSPSEGISVKLSATNQRGDVFELTNAQISNAQLDVSYAPVGSEEWTSLVFSGASSEIAVATLPVTEFAAQQSINIRLLRVIASDSSSSSTEYIVKELGRKTIAFVRDGEDSHEREWIFLRSTVAITFGDAQSQYPKPALIAGGEVSPAGAARDNDRDKNQDDWVPQGWWDEPQGVNADYPYEYGAYRDYVSSSENSSSSSSDDGGHWGDFSEPRIWSHYGQDGTVLQRMYKSTNSATYSGELPASYGNDPNGWGTKPTGISSYSRYRWMTERRSEDGGTTWGTGWSTPQIDAYLSEDGTSVKIAGAAYGVIGWGEDLPTNPLPNETYLMNNGDYDWLEVWNDEDGWWEGYGPKEGTCYIVDNNLWCCTGHQATSTSPAWVNLGRFKGEPGADGKNSIHLDIDNEYEDMLYNDAGTRISSAVTSQARLYDGPDQVNSAQVEWTISDDNGSTWGTAVSTNAAASISNVGILSVTGLVADTVRIKVRARYNNKYYYAEFASNKVYQDRYKIYLSPNALTYNQANYSTKTIGITVEKLDIQGNISNIVFGDYTSKEEISTTTDKGYLRMFVIYDLSSTRRYMLLRNSVNIAGYPAQNNDSIFFELRKYTDPDAANDRDYTVLDYESVPIAHVENGENNIHADLDNEHEDMLYNDAGSRISSVITSQARLYDGEDDVTSSNELSWEISDDEDTWVGPGETTSTNALASITSDGLLSIEALYSASVKIKVCASYYDKEYYAEFTANKICQDKYNLVLSQNSVSYNPSTYTPKNIVISARRLDLKGNTTDITFGAYNNKSKISTTSGKGYLRLFTALVTGSSVGTKTVQLSDTYNVSAQIANANDGVYFELRKYDNAEAADDSTYTVLDYETVPVTKARNGADGAKAPYNVYAYARYDSRAANASTGAPTGNIDSSVGWAAQAPAPVSGYPYIWQRVSAYNSSDALQSTSYICLTGATGASGSNGHTGRFFYYAGEYDSSEIYRIENSQAPYVKYNSEFWMLDYHGSEPPFLPWPTDGHPVAPSDGSGNPWTKMASEQKYYIARAFFGENANLGSFIINGDWMISQYGTYKPDANTTIVVNGDNILTYPTAYTHFKASDPQATGEDPSGASTYPCFAPNFAVDGLTGETYQNNAYLQGEVHATSGNFQNVSISGGMRSPFTYISPNGTLQTNLSDNVAIYSDTVSSDGTIYNLPWDSSQSGRRVIVTNYKWQSGLQNSEGYARLKAPSGKYFYEDGKAKSFITLSREVVELIGYGDPSSFYGWIVLSRTDLGTQNGYGHYLKALAVGKVSVGWNGRPMTANGATFDGSEMNVTRIAEGKYKISFEDAGWFATDEDISVIVTGYGNNWNGPRYASIHSMDKTSFEVWTGDDDSLNEGSFTFVVLNLTDWAKLNLKEGS